MILSENILNTNGNAFVEETDHREDWLGLITGMKLFDSLGSVCESDLYASCPSAAIVHPRDDDRSPFDIVPARTAQQAQEEVSRVGPA